MIHNVPAYAHDYPFYVVREVDGELWFWGAYRDVEQTWAIIETMNDARVVYNLTPRD